MKHYVRFLRETALAAASLGVIVGGVFAVSEIALQQYLAQGLWRTALDLLCHHTCVGALIGAGAAVFLALWLVVWGVRPAAADLASQRPVVGPATRLARAFMVCATAAVLLAPETAPLILGFSYWYGVAAASALVWVIVSSYLADAAVREPDDDPGPAGFGLLWYQFVGLSLVLAASHVWARGLPVWQTGFLFGLGLLGAMIVFRLLFRPARFLTAWFERVTAWAGGASMRLIPTGVMALGLALWLVGGIVAMRTQALASASRMNIIVIAVDTLRWDAVSLLASDEHERDLTPNLREQLAGRATVFTRAYSQAPWTLPAFASIFTGLYPEQHKAEHVWSLLEPEQTTLAEVLREHGYATMEVVSGHYVTKEVGMAQGFDLSDESLAAGAHLISSERVTDRALQFLSKHGEAPFFLFLHYFDPHVPYLTHPEVSLDSPRADERVDIEASAREPWWAKPAGKAMATLGGNLVPYKEEVAYTDLHIGRLLAFLDERRLWENTCVVFVADHGEEFFEHGGAGHDNTLFEELIHVPLCIFTPSLDLPHVVSAPVETRWLFRSLLEVAGIPAPDTVPPAPSLLAAEDVGGEVYMRSSACPRGQTGVTGSQKPTAWLSSLTGAREKLIEDHLRGQAMYFDLLQDPGELLDLGEQQPEAAGRLRELLTARDQELVGTRETGPSPALSEETRQRLKSLGYL